MVLIIEFILILMLHSYTSYTCESKLQGWQSTLCDPSRMVANKSCITELPYHVADDDCIFIFEKDTTRCEFEDLPVIGMKESLHNLKLEAYRYNRHYVLTSLNMTMSHVKWNALKIKFKPENEVSVCMSFRINTKIHLPEEWVLFYDCPLYPHGIENNPAELLYAAEVNGSYESKKYSFFVPSSRKLDPCDTTLESHETLTYMDVTFLPEIKLYIQSLPAHLNITKYEVKKCLCTDCKNVDLSVCEHYSIIESRSDYHHLTLNINIAKELEYRSFFFAIFAHGNSCRNSSCYISRTAVLTVPDTSIYTLLLWLAVAGIVLIILLTVCCIAVRRHIEKLNSAEMLNMIEPSVLIVYQPTDKAHMKVIRQLIHFFEHYCFLDVLFDLRDIPKTSHKDPLTWYVDAVSSAKFIAIVSSVSPGDEQQTAYRDLYTVGLRFIRELIQNKEDETEIFTILLPYCVEVPHSMKYMKCFKFPKDFKKIMHFIHRHTVNKSVMFQKFLLKEIQNNFTMHSELLMVSLAEMETTLKGRNNGKFQMETRTDGQSEGKYYWRKELSDEGGTDGKSEGKYCWRKHTDEKEEISMEEIDIKELNNVICEKYLGFFDILDLDLLSEGKSSKFIERKKAYVEQNGFRLEYLEL